MTPLKIPVKIICGCGQKYAFDVYPVNDRMPAPVRCPVCGLDGTAAANEVIALALKPAPAPLSLRPHSLPNPPPLETASGEAIWRQRALEAERRAEQAQAVARAGLAPHLAQAVKEAVVQELAAQRRELLQAQDAATRELAAMIQRLDSLQTPLADRLRCYETRIQELEKELAARNEENRELLKLKIEMLRRQLDTERVRSRLEFNSN